MANFTFPFSTSSANFTFSFSSSSSNFQAPFCSLPVCSGVAHPALSFDPILQRASTSQDPILQEAIFQAQAQATIQAQTFLQAHAQAHSNAGAQVCARGQQLASASRLPAGPVLPFFYYYYYFLLYNLFKHGKTYSCYKKDNKLILILILVYKIAVWGLVYSSKYLLTAFLNLACV